MSLVKPKPKIEVRPITYDDPIAEKIQRRRYQILVHSFLYYELDMSLVPDDKWSSWAQELVDLQVNYPDVSSKVIFFEAFKNFDGSTGFYLPYTDAQIVKIASRLLAQEKGAEAASALYRAKYQVRCTPAEIDRYLARSRVNTANMQRKEVSRDAKKPHKGLFKLSRS